MNKPAAKGPLYRQIVDRVWLEVVRFTHRRGGALVREGRVGRDLTWDLRVGSGHKSNAFTVTP